MTRGCPPGPARTASCSEKDVVLDVGSGSSLGSTLAKWEVWADHLKTPQDGVKCKIVLFKVEEENGRVCMQNGV